jgi:hypothetical protein
VKNWPWTEHLFFVDDGDQFFEVVRCLACGEMLDLLDLALHSETHPDYAMEDA